MEVSIDLIRFGGTGNNSDHRIPPFAVWKRKNQESLSDRGPLDSPLC